MYNYSMDANIHRIGEGGVFEKRRDLSGRYTADSSYKAVVSTENGIFWGQGNTFKGVLNPERTRIYWRRYSTWHRERSKEEVVQQIGGIGGWRGGTASSYKNR